MAPARRPDAGQWHRARTRLQAPDARDAAAEALSVVTGIAVILAVTRWLFRIPAATPTSRLVGYSVLIVALTVAYEFGIGFASGRSLHEMLANYAIWNGRLWPFVHVALASTPWLWRGR